MPASKRRMAAKSALLAPVGPIMAWGVEQLLSGQPVTGAAAFAIGTALVVAFVAIQEYDLPYESEITDLLAAQSTAQTEDTAIATAERVGEYAGESDQTTDTETEG